LRSQHIFFSSQLRFTVNADWSRFIFFAVRLAFFAVEHIIGAEVNQSGALFSANLGKNARRLRIDQKRPFRLRFANVDLRETCCVDQDVKTCLLQFLPQVIQIREIQLRTIEAGDLEPIAIFAQQCRAKPSARAQNYDFHACLRKNNQPPVFPASKITS
jgi:hypothetical protein